MRMKLLLKVTNVGIAQLEGIVEEPEKEDSEETVYAFYPSPDFFEPPAGSAAAGSSTSICGISMCTDIKLFNINNKGLIVEG